MSGSKKKNSKEYWRLIEAEFRKSGLSMKRFCELKNISLASARKHFAARQGQQNSKYTNNQSNSQKKRRNWQEIHEIWLKDDFDSLTDFAHQQGFDPTSGHFQRMTKGWIEEKARMRRESAQKSKFELFQNKIAEWDELNLECYRQVSAIIEMQKKTEHEFLRVNSSIETSTDLKNCASANKTRLETIKMAYDLLKELKPGSTKNAGELFEAIDNFNLECELSGMEGFSYKDQVQLFERCGFDPPHSIKTCFDYEKKRENDQTIADQKNSSDLESINSILDLRKFKGLGPLETADYFIRLGLEVPEPLKLEVKKEVQEFGGQAHAVIANHHYSDHDAYARRGALYKAYSDGMLTKKQYMELVTEEDLKIMRRLVDNFPKEEQRKRYREMLDTFFKTNKEHSQESDKDSSKTTSETMENLFGSNSKTSKGATSEKPSKTNSTKKENNEKK